MGLEGVELIMEVEDRFGISIPDEDAEQMTTVGAIHEYVVERLRELPDQKNDDRCPSAVMFYRVRSALQDTLGIERRRIQPDTRFTELIPRSRHYRAWSKLEKRLGFKLPNLEYPRWRGLSIVLVLALLLALAAHQWIVGESAFSPAISIYAFVAAVYASIAWMALTDHFGRIPVSCATVGDLAKTFVSPTPNMLRIVRDSDPAVVWDGLREIISEQLGVRPEKILPETRLVEDLGC